MVTWPLMVQGFFLALGTTLVAGVFPAWRASRLKVVDALRTAR
jgi:putative ABC transport system permease protein